MALSNNNKIYKYAERAIEGSNIETDEDYKVSVETVNGVTTGKANASNFNKALKQSSTISSAVAEFMASKDAGFDINDTLTPEAIAAQLDKVVSQGGTILPLPYNNGGYIQMDKIIADVGEQTHLYALLTALFDKYVKTKKTDGIYFSSVFQSNRFEDSPYRSDVTMNMSVKVNTPNPENQQPFINITIKEQTSGRIWNGYEQIGRLLWEEITLLPVEKGGTNQDNLGNLANFMDNTKFFDELLGGVANKTTSEFITQLYKVFNTKGGIQVSTMVKITNINDLPENEDLYFLTVMYYSLSSSSYYVILRLRSVLNTGTYEYIHTPSIGGTWITTISKQGESNLGLNNLNDVTIESPSEAQALVYEGTQWKNKPLPSGVTTLSGLSDVKITSPTIKDVLQWNGSHWVDTQLPSFGAVFVIDNQNKFDEWVNAPTDSDLANRYTHVVIYDKGSPYTSTKGIDLRFKTKTIEGIGLPTLQFNDVEKAIQYSYENDSNDNSFYTRNLNIVVINSAGLCDGLYQVHNNFNVKIIVKTTTDYAANAFHGCDNNTNCSGTASSPSRTTAGFYGCDNNTNCSGTATCDKRNAAYGFVYCNNNITCSGTGISISSSPAVGFGSCNYIVSCKGKGESRGMGSTSGFSDCKKVIACQGWGLSVNGNGHAFFNCYGMLLNSHWRGESSKSGCYSNCKADFAGNQVVADDANGGFNTTKNNI